jgi:hypothetical protein
VSRGRVLAAALAGLGGALAAPAGALAHGIVIREDLPVPEWLFAWAATIVLIASFVALAVLWPQPRLQEDSWRPLGGLLSRALASRPLELACGLVGAGLLVLVVWSGLVGQQIASANFAPTLVYVIVWVGFVPASILFGDLFHAFNPWRAIGRAFGWSAARVARGSLPDPLEYPARLGRWPAVAGIVLFV